jgi:hypothetical protein
MGEEKLGWVKSMTVMNGLDLCVLPLLLLVGTLFMPEYHY